MERAAKLARLEDFRRSKPACSASAMHAILQDIAKNGLPELRDRMQMAEARDALINSDTAYGQLVRFIYVIDKNGEPMEIALACPFATFSHFINQSTSAGNNSFRAFLKQRLLETPPSVEQPWDIILYSDEVTPGNPIAPVNNRKFHIVYWSFMQLGANGLAREEAWLPLLIEFSCVVNRVHAGISQVFKECIKTFFQPGGLNFSTNGLLLEFPDGDVRIWAKLGGILQDGGAHKYVYMIRGDGASKFCMLCRNLFTEASNVCEAGGNIFG
jgi:AraC-like DNA-binding protein